MKESRRYLPRSVIVVISTVVAIIGVALAAHSMPTATLVASPAVVPSHAPGAVA